MVTPAARHVFGPVPSRRLGRSLGVDPLPLKACNFSCVYCQLGRTRRRQLRRRCFVNIADVVTEIATVLARHRPDTVDWITFVGSGETSLYSRLGTLVRFAKGMTEIPVAVITNGSLLHVPRVRRELEAADAVLTSLDAGTEPLYRAVNRPHPELSFERHVRGLIDFGRSYGGRLWVEVMLVGGVNDSERALTDIAEILHRVRPDEIHVSTPSRPPAEPWVQAPGSAAIERATAILGDVARVLRPARAETALELDGDLVDAIFNVVRRHPLGDEELERLLGGWASAKVAAALAELRGSGRFQVVERFGKGFWCAADLDFPLRTESSAADGHRARPAALPAPA